MTPEVPASAALTTRRRWLVHKRDRTHAADATVGIAASFTAEPIEAYLGAQLLEHGRSVEVTFADYNQIHQVCFDPQGMLGPVDALVVLWRVEDMFAAELEGALHGAAGPTAALVSSVADLGRALASLASTVAHPVLVSLPPVPAPPGLDPFDSAVGVQVTRLHARLTEAFLAALDGSAVRLADLPGWLRELGGAHARDVLKQLTYKQPYTTAFWHLLGTNVADLLARETVAAPKCIVLDCDNTLWGGVIGEDGLGGIALSSVFPGSAYQEFQRVLKRLRDRGVLLAVNSKNNHADVVEVFEKHDDMVLRVDDIAVWRVNWGLKSHNLREIAAELNIGEDALVFIDDSHYELAEIAAALPHITCLQVPEEVALLPDLVADSGLFRNLQVSAEDAARTEMIISERARQHDVGTMTKDDFLRSLELRVEYFPVHEEHVGRVAQLTNKTNQFNLTTTRRSEAEVRALLQDDAYAVRAMRVSDKFGDYGLVGVGILHTSGDRCEIETLLMSCRVLGRGVESAFLALLAADAADSGAAVLVGRYVATPKNALVSDLYPKHGFDDVGDGFFETSPTEVPRVPEHITAGP